MAYTFDYVNSLINILSPQTTVDCQDLYDAIVQEQASVRGINYPPIVSASGKESLGSGVQVGITVELLGPWQINFYAGNYVGTVSGGNLVGGPGGDPVAYSPGVQVLLIQSAASTVVVTSNNSTAADNALAVWGESLEVGFTAQQVMRLMASALAGKVSGSATNTITFRDLNDTKDRIIANVDSDGNRNSVIKNVS